MGGAWVFPGGIVDDDDRSDVATAAMIGPHFEDAAWRAAALRELVEEVGVWFGDSAHTVADADRPHGLEIYRVAVEESRPFAADRLMWFSTWVTPTLVPVRFDARFYVATIEDGIDGVPDGREIDAVAWIDPARAIEDARRGELLLPFPTRKTLEHFAALGTAHAVVEHAARQTAVPRIQPRLRIAPDDTIEALLPGEPGYDQLTDLPPDPDALARAVRVTSARGEAIPELGRRGD